MSTGWGDVPDDHAWYWAFHTARVAEVYDQYRNTDHAKKAHKARYIGITAEGFLLRALGMLLAQCEPGRWVDPR